MVNKERVKIGDHVRVLNTQLSTGLKPVGIVDNIDGYYFDVRVKVDDIEVGMEYAVFEAYENELEIITKEQYFKEVLRGANNW